MNVYRQTREEDILLAGWWHRMDEDDDLRRTFTAGSQTMAELLRMMQRPNLLLYEYDAAGLWFAMWFEPVMAGAFAGAWTRPDYRHRRAGLYAFLDALDIALKGCSVVVGITKQPELIRGHERLGYHRLGEIPGLFDGKDATVLTITREGLEQAKKKYRRALADPVMA